MLYNFFFRLNGRKGVNSYLINSVMDITTNIKIKSLNVPPIQKGKRKPGNGKDLLNHQVVCLQVNFAPSISFILMAPC